MRRNPKPNLQNGPVLRNLLRSNPQSPAAGTNEKHRMARRGGIRSSFGRKTGVSGKASSADGDKKGPSRVYTPNRGESPSTGKTTAGNKPEAALDTRYKSGP
jgi:hypothetical protein